MEQNLEDKISKLETENRNLKERVDREINEKYAIKSFQAELGTGDDVEVKANVKAVLKIDIEPEEAFRILCKSLKMHSVLKAESENFEVIKNEYGKSEVWLNGEIYDDRGKLFLALVDVSRCIFPGL